jgi:pimeloyl-ACP methyl ester carboxylesterase
VTDPTADRTSPHAPDVDRVDVPLPDGRRLEVWLAGPADGLPVVSHHGTPGCGRPDRLLVATAAERGIRLVRPSRPGYGGSDRHPGRDVFAVAADTAAVLDTLGHGRVAVMGGSGGGPHALATAAGLGERVVAVATLAGAGPYDGEGLDFLAGMGQDNLDEFGAALAGEEQLRPFLAAVRQALLVATPEQIVEELGSLLPAPDRAVLNGELGEDIAENFRHALAPGIEGWLDDDIAFTRPWGFDLNDVRVPVSVWQGDLDLMVPAAHGRWLAAALPTARPHLLPDDGHLSIEAGRAGEILDELVAPLRG